MGSEVQTAAFEGGSLRVMASGEKSRETVLALSLSRLLVKMVRVPAGEDPVAFSEPILKALSPFPDEPLTVSCETVSESETGKVVVAAALPEGATDDIAAALDEAKLNVVRVDALVLGALRGFWGDLKVEDGQRRLLRLKSVDCLTLIVLDGDQPVSIRSVPLDSPQERETMLSLLEAEDFNGPRMLGETVEREIDVDAALSGVRERTFDPAAFNALPASWREVLQETRFKAKLVKNLSVAGGLWLLVMAVLFGVPMVYGYMTDHMKELCNDHSRAYRAVSAQKAKVEIFRQYSDHARGLLEIMKAVSDRLPAGITLSRWEFDRQDGLRIRGESETSGAVREFKDALAEMAIGEELVFPSVKLGSTSAQKDGKHKFDLDCKYLLEEQE